MNINKLAESINIHNLPNVLAKDRNKLPNNVGGCYFVKSKDVLLYIGQTSQEGGFRNRWSAHHRYQQIMQFVNPTIAYYICSDDIALDLERALIELHSPLLQNTAVPVIQSINAASSLQKTDTERNTEALNNITYRLANIESQIQNCTRLLTQLSVRN